MIIIKNIKNIKNNRFESGLENRLKSKICLMFALLLAASCVMQNKAEVFADGESWPQGPDISSPSAIVMEVNTGTVLYEKNSHEQHYPASITKILTSYLAIKNCDMDETVTFSEDAVYKNEGDTSHISRDVGEEMTMEQTLYGIMLESANECAYAAAEHVGQKLGGDYSTFINLMNETASELGCTDTHFNNANGLPDDQHYTSAYDMALISCEAYKNDEFRKITGTKTYTIPPTNKHSTETILNNHHGILHKYRTVTQYVNEYCTGGKTGYTTVANSTLVTYAEKDGLTLCVVIMNATSPSHWEDTNTLINYCFSNFKALSIADNEAEVAESVNENLGVLNENEMFASMSENYIVLPNSAEFKDATKETLDDSDDDTIAAVQYVYADHVVGEVKLVQSGASVDLSAYANSSKASSENTIKVKPVYVVAVVVLVIILALMIYFGRKLFENYYVIKHKRAVKKEQRARFKEQKEKRKRRKRRDLSFRKK